jgi:hypothetical protein
MQEIFDTFPIHNGLKQGEDVLPSLFNSAVKYAIRKVQENYEGLKLHDAHELLVYDDVNLLGQSINTIKTDDSKEVGL